MAKHKKRSHSAICAELIQAALELKKYKEELSQAKTAEEPSEDSRKYTPQAQIRNAAALAAVQGADLNTDKLQKLLKLLEILEAD